MCRYCPPSAITCFEPVEVLLPLCPVCREERGSEAHYPTAAMVAELELTGDVALCADCYAREAEAAHDPLEGCECELCAAHREEMNARCDASRALWIEATESALPWELGFEAALHSLFVANDSDNNGEAA